MSLHVGKCDMDHSQQFSLAFFVLLALGGARCDVSGDPPRPTRAPNESYNISDAVKAAVSATRDAEATLASEQPTPAAQITSTGNLPTSAPKRAPIVPR
jgi:hypothetical protein